MNDRVRFHLPNGFELWPVGPGELRAPGEAPAVRRLFEVCSPKGDQHTCAVELAPPVLQSLEQVAGRSLPPEHPFWDVFSRSALTRWLRRRAAFPPGNLLVLRGLREDDVRAALESVQPGSKQS